MPTDKRAVAAAAKQSVLTVLGKRLRDARKRTRYSQLAAAEHIKVTGQTIRNWETGRNEPPMTAIRQLAALYGTTEATLLEDLFDPLLPPQPRHRRFRYGRIAVDSAELSQARRDAGLTQEQVADMTGVHIGAIRRYERGRSNPPVGTLQILASIYGRQAASFTATGRFSPEEQEALETATTVHLPFSSTQDPVLAVYTAAAPHLTEQDRKRIEDFIRLMHRQAAADPADAR